MPSTISAGTTAGTAIAIAGDTTGNLAFQTNGTTTAMTINTSQNVQLNAAGAKILNSSGNPILQQTGSVLQVIQTTKTDTFTTTSTSKVDITGMSVSITPTSSSSKILVIASINYGGTDYNFYCDLLRGSTVLNAPSSGNNPCTISLCGITTTQWEIQSGSISFLDSPATTSSTTYKLQIACQSSGTFYLNRSARDGANDSVCSSTITVMEIAA